MRIPPLNSHGLRIRRGDEVLMFLLGLVSTWQILQIAGFAMSTWLTAVSLLYMILSRPAAFRKDRLAFLLLLLNITTLAVSFFTDLPSNYEITALFTFLQWFLVYALFMYCTQEASIPAVDSFLNGFDWSCRIQLVWCILQMVLYKLLEQDLNELVFGKLLSYDGATSRYRNGELTCTGLHWHGANLTPILLYLYWRHRSLITKLLCLAMVYFSHSATNMIGILLCIGLDFVLFAKRTLVDRSSSVLRKTAVYSAIALIALILISPLLIPKLWDMILYLLERFYQIWNPTKGKESSAVHFNYYKNLPTILKRLPFINVLFGSGASTSGHWFSYFYQQYTNQTWVVESDFVNLTLNYGIAGLTLIYSFVIRTIIYLKRTPGMSRIALWMLVLIPCGIIYNNQFLWVQLVEFMMFCRCLYPRNSIIRGPGQSAPQIGES